MPPEASRTPVSARPFVPFRIHVLDGKTHDIRHPEGIIVAPLYAIIALGQQPAAGHGADGIGDAFHVYDRIELVALRAISSLEPLARPAA
jgi:hypothetical protein